MVRPPVGLIGVSIGTTTFWPGVSGRRRDLGDRPAVDRRRVAVQQPGRLSSSRMTSATPPASYMSVAV